MSDDLDTLTITLGQACSGYEMGEVVTTLLYLLSDCAVQSGVPKHEFLAQAYESLSNFYDEINSEEDNTNGNCSYN